MKIFITEWALDSYCQLLKDGVINRKTYQEILRPDALRLHDIDSDPKFANHKFWGAASERKGAGVVRNGFKMKWHNFGHGQVNLRLCVAILDGEAFLCQGYVKNTEFDDRRQVAKFKDHIQILKHDAGPKVVGEL